MSYHLHFSQITFETWVAHVFDHPVSKKVEWYWKDEESWYGEDEFPEITLRFITQLFENPADVLASYTNSQLNQGLWFLVSNACSNHMFSLVNEKIEIPKRVRGIEAIYSLYEKLFAVRCSPHLGHLDEPNTDPLNTTCYMFWDLIPFGGKPNEPRHQPLDMAALEVMRKTLFLQSDACREGALHGLGHWKFDYPQIVQNTIDEFLERSKDTLRAELKAYAIQARTGVIL